MTNILFITASLLLTYFGVAAFRRWSERRGLIDVPNERSSHTVPTPRGGGLVIVLVTLLLYTVYSLSVFENLNWGFLTGAIIIAAVSLLDDFSSLGFLTRFFIHAAAAAVFVIFSGYFREVYIPGFNSVIGFDAFGPYLTIIWIVWMVNAFNFMDGIDGLAGLQGTIAGFGWMALGFFADSEVMAVFGGIVAMSCFGFLLHNWNPARIFMGDVGSAFLGFTFAVLPLIFTGNPAKYLGFFSVSAVILMWLFVFDAGFTRLVRLLAGKKFWLPNSEHSYQKLVISGVTHSRVSVFFGISAFFISVFLILALISGGIYGYLLLLSLITFPVLLLAWVRTRKRLT